MPESSTILFGCPQCRKRLKVDAKAAGRNFACPDCRKLLVVPASSEPLPVARRAGAFQVFISYSSKDKQWADAACAALEGLGVDCWIAPRDIAPGTEWGAAIIGGIDACKVMVLVFSAHANESPQVRREVERAINKGLVIVPLRVGNVNPSGAMEYALSNMHWLDAGTLPRQETMLELAHATKAVLQGGVKLPRVTTKLLPSPGSALQPAPRSRASWSLLLCAAGFLMLIACAGAGLIGWHLFPSATKDFASDKKEVVDKTPDQISDDRKKGDDTLEPFAVDFGKALKDEKALPDGWSCEKNGIALQLDEKRRASLQVVAKKGEYFVSVHPKALTGDFSITGEFRLRPSYGVLKIDAKASKGGAVLPVAIKSVYPYDRGYVSIADQAEFQAQKYKSWSKNQEDTNTFMIVRRGKAVLVYINGESVTTFRLNEVAEFDEISVGLSAGVGYEGPLGWLYSLKVGPAPP